MANQPSENALTEKQKKLSTYLALPIALMLLIVPLIVHMREETISSSAIGFWKNVSKDDDFFSYYKMIGFLIFTGIIILAFVIKNILIRFEIKKSMLYIPMVIYALFVVLSYFSSSAKDVASKGFPNRYEGVFVILAYLVVMFIVINFLNNENQVKIILGGLAISALLIGIIGVFQYFNMDFFKTKLGLHIMLPKTWWNRELDFQLGPRAVYGTLYHTNYMGGFTAMLFPLTLTMLILVKNKIFKIFCIILNVIMFICLITSHSRAGIAGAILATFLIFVMMALPKLKEDIKKYQGAAVAAIVVFFIALFAVTGLIVVQKISTVLGVILMVVLAAIMIYYMVQASTVFKQNLIVIGILAVLLAISFTVVNSVSKQTVSEKIGTLYNDNSPSVTAVSGIKDVTATKDMVTLSDGTNKLNAAYINGQIKFTDNNGKTIPFNFDSKTNTNTTKEPEYSAYAVTIMKYLKQPVLHIARGEFGINFVITRTGYKVIGANGNIIDIPTIKTFGFKGYENLGSARGYIWSRSLPLLANTIFTGYGPDTFALHFPQEDVIGKTLAYGTPFIMVDKPHNMYLQAGINTGVISLLSLLCLFIMYFIHGFKVLSSRKLTSFTEIAGVGILTAVLGYLIAGLFNDSTISVSPVFWVLLGLGAGINIMLESNEKKA